MSKKQNKEKKKKGNVASLYNLVNALLVLP